MALYEPDGEEYVPSEDTRGPWASDAQHAGPVAALIGRAFEALPAEAPMQVCRLTLELLRPVPLSRLRISAAVERGGRRVQLLGASLHAGDTEVARATAVRIRIAELDGTAGGEVAAADAIPPPGASAPHQGAGNMRAFHETGVEMLFARGSFFTPGPAAVWIRLRVPVVAGETPSPLQRALAAADFGNGVSALLDWQTHLFINPDLTVYLFRMPQGEWICLDARTWLAGAGAGLAVSQLHDERGRIGESLQSLLVDRRHGATT